MSRTRTFLVLLTAVAALSARPAGRPPELDAPAPIAPHETVFIEEMTWVEIRDALKDGKTTVIVPTGGVEQNGPYMVTGKHNFITRAVTEAVAKKLGKTLVAPVIGFVPEGDIDPPTDHMRYPGTISVTEDTYERLLTDICASFRTHGFRDIILLGDSGGNQDGMKAVAEALNKKWAGKPTRVHFIPEFYDEPDLEAWLEKQGIKQKDEGLHDDFTQSAELAAIDPTLIRMKQRQAAGKFSINGIALDPIATTVEWGRKIIALRADVTVAAIRKKLKPR